MFMQDMQHMEMSSEACLLYMQEAGSCIDFIAIPASHLLLTGGLAGGKNSYQLWCQFLVLHEVGSCLKRFSDLKPEASKMLATIAASNIKESKLKCLDTSKNFTVSRGESGGKFLNPLTESFIPFVPQLC
jgi:hypothetical protein